MGKYKYYFRKPKSEIVKDVFSWMLISGAIVMAASSPYFIQNLISAKKRWREYPKKKVYDTFYDLKRRGYLDIKENGHQIYISLTEEGKKKAGRFQIDALKINKPKKWDGKWRLVIFDIAQLKKLQRNVFRGKLKELGFYPLQKSVWTCPYKCTDEISLLRDFFGLNEKNIRIITAENIEEDSFLKKIFKIA